MPQSKPVSGNTAFLVLVGLLVVLTGAALGYVAGWFSPDRLTPKTLVHAFAPASGPPLGHRRNHAKGICFTGELESTGAGTEISRARIFTRGSYPVLGRFNLGSPDPNASDAAVRIRGMSLLISGPDAEEWRTAMINAPVFTTSTPRAFYELLLASKSSDPNAMASFTKQHPEFAAFASWANNGPWMGSFAEERFNGLNSFIFENAAGVSRAVRWSFVPETTATPVSPAQLSTKGPDFLEQDITERVARGPVRWRLIVTVASRGDPTADPTRAWPPDRPTINVGALVVRNIEPERDGPCREINFDPTVLPAGMKTSDDPFPAARSAAYARSYDLRTAEARDYPRTVTGDAQ